MTGSLSLPMSIDALKGQARRLRAKLRADGVPISHGKSLEFLAHQHGFKDWNTLLAAARGGPTPCPAPLGARVRGRYLGQPFQGEVIAVQALSPPGRFRITLSFDAPVDVVTFASFSNLRRRVSCVIDAAGRTRETTSNGRPQLELAV